MTFTRAHYELYTYRLRYLNRNTISLNQFRSIEFPMYLYWAVIPLECPGKQISVPYVGDPTP